VDARTGYDRTGETAGRLSAEEARVIKMKGVTSRRGLVPGEYLMPVFNEKGQVRGYDRSLTAEHQAMLEQNQDLAAMIGAWTGRILEEEVSRETNKELLKAVKSVYDLQGSQAKYADDFTNVADPNHKDPLVRDAWNTLGWEIKELAEEMYGRPDFFPVRKESVKDVIGVRSASVTGPTGTSEILLSAALVIESDLYLLHKAIFLELRIHPCRINSPTSAILDHRSIRQLCLTS